MTTLPASTRPAECLSDFRFDALLGGELPAAEAGAAELHIASCERCARRAGELRAEVQAFDLPMPTAPPHEAKIVPLRSSRHATWVRRGAAASAFAAIAAAAFLWIPTGITGDDGIRTKGSAHVGFFVEHAGRVRRGFPGEKVEPGDKLQLVVATHEAAHVAVVSIDGAQKPNVYYASNKRVGPTIGAAEEPLPVSILLDDVLGNELLWGLVCKRAQDEAELLRILRRDGARFSHPQDCVQTAWTITKVARSP